MISQPLLDAIVTFAGSLSAGQSSVGQGAEEALEELMKKAVEELDIGGAAIALRDDAGDLKIIAAQFAESDVGDARAAGVHIHTFPLRLNDVDLGSVDFFRTTSEAWPRQHRRTAQLFAAMVSSHLLLARKVDEATTAVMKVRRALDRNAPIEQAKGMVASILWITPGEAFELIRAYARRHQTKVLDVANDLLSRQLSTDLLEDTSRQRQAA